MKKPKKFGAGGVLAGLAGLGALAYMASKKGDKEDSGKSETYIDKQLKRAKEMPEPEPTPEKGIASDFKSSESKFERNDNEKSLPDVKPAGSIGKGSGIKKLSEDSDTAKKLRAQHKGRLGETYSRMYTRLQDKDIPEGPGKEALRSAVDKARKDYEDAPMRKGGAVKKMAKGGMAKSSASSRGDGCAMRGKTKGKIY